MGNMSYVRFENTLHDLRDCDEHIYDDDLSDEETRARLKLIKLCKKIYLENKDEIEEDAD